MRCEGTDEWGRVNPLWYCSLCNQSNRSIHVVIRSYQDQYTLSGSWGRFGLKCMLMSSVLESFMNLAQMQSDDLRITLIQSKSSLPISTSSCMDESWKLRTLLSLWLQCSGMCVAVGDVLKRANSDQFMITKDEINQSTAEVAAVLLYCLVCVIEKDGDADLQTRG